MGLCVGFIVGMVGCLVGLSVGFHVGRVGDLDGFLVGYRVGLLDGNAVLGLLHVSLFFYIQKRTTRMETA